LKHRSYMTIFLPEQSLIFHKEAAEKHFWEEVGDEDFIKSHFFCFTCWMPPYPPLFFALLCAQLSSFTRKPSAKSISPIFSSRDKHEFNKIKYENRYMYYY